MVKSPPSNAGAAGLIPGQGAKILHNSCPKNQNIKQKLTVNYYNSICYNTVKNSIKTLQNGSHQKKKTKKTNHGLFSPGQSSSLTHLLALLLTLPLPTLWLKLNQTEGLNLSAGQSDISA